jgi:hypothetical protein
MELSNILKRILPGTRSYLVDFGKNRSHFSTFSTPSRNSSCPIPYCRKPADLLRRKITETPSSPIPRSFFHPPPTESMPQSTRTHPLIEFYSESAPDAENRTLRQILSSSDEWLEYCHNYIQILFPLPEPAGAYWRAPVIDREVFEAFRKDEKLRKNLRRAFERILRFYGFEVEGVEDPTVSWHVAASEW